ncbi:MULTISPECIES: molecular chaperone [unclassified Rhizobium]|jgi:fimbrial chaperone protein|uniref:fimbrial biogenesis chaperone n=1 Tax=unclassified Rhizobium TaxID=2613769 RepID=UPI0006483765|nr:MULTISPECIES: molecular chaperone [unclassified Rhizobium]MBN8952935.1 molecular chaperone [Rhizobium tropici]OJY76652.1 MAG: pilus assembly protein [Rhizobium sp. 60-20]RKD52660.1 fimbrial chaperone protein [Rhizobium sp. WW_1]
MQRMLPRIAATMLLLLSAYSVNAASLRVAPTSLELIAPSATTVLNLANEGDHPINVQIRVFKWSQTGGVESLEPTRDVVASPPSTRMSPNAQYVVRVVRTSKVPVRAEETYRVIVDELPDPSRARAGTVTFIMRQSIPVFFKRPDVKPADIAWSLKRQGNSLSLTGKNNGGSRFRLSNAILAQGPTKIGSRNGLVGYVLAGATMQWPIGAAKSLTGGGVTLHGQSDLGPFDAKVAVNQP